MEQLDLLGGAVPSGPPRVPPVTFHHRPHRRSIRGETRVQCGHCQMNASRFHDGHAVGDWADESDVMILKAIALITNRDGSTLRLCAQHAQEHEERGDRDG